MFTENIKIIMLKKDISVKELAARIGTSSSNITNKFHRDNLSEKDLLEILKALDCSIQYEIIDNNTGKKLN